MKYTVSFRPMAEADLFDLYEYIASEAGYEVSAGYIDRIEAACLSLERSPLRGTKRDDLRPGIRTMGFERRAIIVFRVLKADVLILRVFYGGQDFEAALRSSSEE